MSDSPGARLRDLIMGLRATQLLHVAACLEVADQLGQGARSAQQIARAVGAEPRALHRLLRALASLGLVAPQGDERYALTPMGEPLRRDHPASLHPLAVLYGAPWLWQAYGALKHSVRTGEVAFEHVHGRRFFDFLSEAPSEAETFDDAMSAYSDTESEAILEAYPDFAALRNIVDVGGGRGALLRAILRRHVHLHGTLFERENVIAAARSDRIEARLSARLRYAAGDFFARIEPSGASAYLLKSVLHDWDDAAARALLGACRAAMTGARSKLLLIERLLPDDDSPSPAALFDINMLVTVGGQERSVREHAALLGAAGLRIVRIVPTACGLGLIEAVPAG